MSEEKKDDTQGQQDFLSGHEELLNAIHKKTDKEPSEENAPEVAASQKEAIVAEEAAEPAEKIEEPVAEPEAVTEEPEQVDEPAPEPELPEEEPEPVIEESPAPAQKEEPVKAAPAAKEPAPKKKKAHHKTDKTVRTEEEKKRHEEILKNQALEDSEVKEVLNFFQKYLKPVVIAIVLVCGIFLAINLIRSNRANKVTAADALMAEGKFQEVLDGYDKTPSAPMALMGLAQKKFDSSQPAEAEKLYGEFVQKYPDHEMAVQAEFNQIACKEAMGALGEAIILYGDFHKNHPKSHLAPVALLGKARSLELLDTYDQAKLVYEDIITFYPESGWSQMAETKLNVVESKLK